MASWWSALAGDYLDGDPQLVRFFRLLCLTLASVLTLIVSGNLILFAAAWIATSLGLHQLLLFYADRPAARLAARKKFLFSRLGDLCLIGVLALIWRSFGAIDFATILPTAEGMAAGGIVPADLSWIAGLLVVAALLKSAQFPVHGWLLEVMETPTPVSALLHAEIINAGGFLVLRFGDVIAFGPVARPVGHRRRADRAVRLGSCSPRPRSRSPWPIPPSPKWAS